MVLERLLATIGATFLFGAGVAAAALADARATTTETTTTATTTTTTTTAATTTTSTATSPPTTTTTAETTTATVPTTTVTSTPRTVAPIRLPRGANVSDTPTENAQPAQPRRKKHRRRISKPLKVTPPLGGGSYVFPLVGPSGYGDSYGGYRGDVHGKWHHGDDIFASLGTPVVAVANGTINRVGWHKVGGWRLWVRDAAADEFYYAHLSGYAPSILRSNRVTAGQVIGFVGNTGDAYGGAPHLHFEVHPRQLLRLRYDGAVDPTTYLDSWPHLQSVHAPTPVHPRLPRQPTSRSEARYVFRELLVARHLVEPPPTPSEQPEADVPRGLISVSPPPLAPKHELPAIPTVAAGSSTLTIPLLAGLLSVAAFVATTVLAGVLLVRVWR